MRIVGHRPLLIAAGAAFACLLAASPATPQSKDEKRAFELLDRKPEWLVPYIKVEGDSLDPQIKISTYGVTARTSKGLLASTTTENSFLRGYIDRKTGEVSAQIYQSMTYGGRGFDSFRRATYESPDGIEEVATSTVDSDVSCQRYGCTHFSDVVFPVKMDVLRAAAKAFDPNNPRTGLKYRLFGQSGTNVDDVVPSNELVAFVRVVDRELGRLSKSPERP